MTTRTAPRRSRRRHDRRTRYVGRRRPSILWFVGVVVVALAATYALDLAYLAFLLS